jgi:error-prone DNA polymerase
VRAYAAVKEFYEETGIPESQWIKLLIGARLETRDGYSLLAYPMNVEGYKRLSLLLSQGNREAAKGECDLTIKDLAEYTDDILAIVLPPRKIEDPAFHDRLRRLAVLYPGRCYLAGTMLFRGDDERRLARLDALAAQTGVRLVATNDVHYHAPERRALHDVVTAIRLKCTVEELGFHRFAIGERHLKPAKDMQRLFREHPQAIERIHEVVDRCQFSLDQLRYQYPVEYEGGETPMQKLERLTWKGAAFRYPEGIPDTVAATIRHEFDLISRKGIAPYFPDRARDCQPGARDGHSVPGPRLGRQLGRLLLPSGYRGRPRTRTTCCSSASCRTNGTSRPISTWISSTSGARTSSSGSTGPRGGPAPPWRHGDRLSQPQRHSRRGQGARPVADTLA